MDAVIAMAVLIGLVAVALVSAAMVLLAGKHRAKKEEMAWEALIDRVEDL